MKKLKKNTRLVSWIIATIIRAICATTRMRVHDKAGILEKSPDHPLIWGHWHNRIFIMPILYRRYTSFRTGSVLTSASGDGGVIAAVVARFGIGAVRGSSSRGGARALRTCLTAVEEGQDLVFTPDGPRGPKYKVQRGMIKVASATGAPVFLIHSQYSAPITLKTWDNFIIPRPFSRIDITLSPYIDIPPDLDDDGIQEYCEKIEALLLEGTQEEAS